MKRIGVLTSGGDAPGMNAAIRAVVRTALDNDMSVIGFKRGYNGLLMRSKDQIDDFELLTSRSVSGIVHKGGTFLMTARCKEFLKKDVQQLALRNLRALGVEGMVCIGGNGTFAGAQALSELGMPTIGVPGTIDNDLAYTDYTIGFDTALNTAIDAVDKIRDTGDAHERASIVTVMGRDCGDLAVHSALACGAEVALVPEIHWTLEDVAYKVRWGVLSGKKSMIIIFAEGALSSLDSDVASICEKFPALSDVTPNHLSAFQIAEIIEALAGQETRATVLGYIMRGGSPSANDRILATRTAARAVELLRDGQAGLAVGIRENRIVDVPLDRAMEGNTFDPDIYELVSVTGAIKI